MTHHRNVVEHYLNYPESEEFATWAWGEDFKILIRDQLPEKWNRLHGDSFMLDGSGLITEDIPRMIDLWRKQNETK